MNKTRVIEAFQTQLDKISDEIDDLAEAMYHNDIDQRFKLRAFRDEIRRMVFELDTKKPEKQ